MHPRETKSEKECKSSMTPVCLFITTPTLTMTSEILIVESHNNSHEGNVTSSFKVRLPRDLVFHQTHQIGLVDVSIPNTIFNIQPHNYLILSVFGKKVIKTASSKVNRNQPYAKPVPVNNTSVKEVTQFAFRKPEAESVKLTVKAAIHPGFYGDMKKLQAELAAAVFRVVRDQKLKLSNVPSAQDILENKFFKNDQEGWFACDAIGDHNEEVKKSYLTSVLSRLTFRSSMGMFGFKPLKKETQGKNDICFHFSEDLGLVFGYPPTQNRVLLPSTLTSVLYAPNLARIQSEDTIYLYCPQVQNSIVSNFEVPILRCLPFSSRKLGFGDMYFQEFVNQVYLDLVPQRVHTLEFELRNNRGELVHFEAGSKPVRLTLKIRPKNLH